ncbi:MAG TPA: signal recognition particle protein, partial [Aeromicrobium sp.]|nr:signal recognition particle protein [Aeromicrobium sp.]
PEPGNDGVARNGGNPVKVAKNALKEAKRTLHDVVIIDTAGRLGIDAELMKQARNIRDATDPDEVLFVVDAMTGQDAVHTAQAFAEGVDFTGVVLTKLDGDARGGAALSVRSITGRPIMFASTGEKLDDFEAFHPDRMASRILDMGDVLTLIEQAEKAFDAEQAAKDAEKLVDGSFTLQDFLTQMEALSKMGSMTKIMGMLPGMGQFKEQLANFDEREIDRTKAIILSMTPAERANPKLIDGSRRSRIAKGSGCQVADVNGLVDRFEQARRMMQQMARTGSMGSGGMPGMPGMPGMGAGMPGMPSKRAAARQRPQGSKKKGKRVSGNPAKRAATPDHAPGSASSMPFELPKELKDLL